MAVPARRIDYMPLNGIPRAARNPKSHDLRGIRAAIERFGCTLAGILDERTGRLVAGHGRLAALEAMRTDGAHPPDGVEVAADGAWLVPIQRGWASRSDSEAEAYVVADNRLSEKGGWDDPLLADVLADIGRADAELLAVTGYSADDLADLDAALEADAASPVERGEALPEPGDAEQDERPVVWGVVVTCEGEQQQVELLERLSSEGYQVRALM